MEHDQQPEPTPERQSAASSSGRRQSPAGKRAPVIKDVAALANVSVSTVSRYLNDSPKLSEESRARIAHAIALLDYRPSRVARGLVNSAVQSIAVLSSNTTLYGSAMTIQGVEDEARANGYPVTIAKLDGESTAGLRASVNMVMDLNPGGVVVLNYDAVAREALAMLPDSVAKVAIAGDRVDDVAELDQIDLCENQAGRELTEYLLGLGHRTVIHVTIPGGGGGYSRTAGWEAALRGAGLPVPDVRHCTWNPKDAREIGRRIGRGVVSGDATTAVFAGNDEIAMGVIRGLADCGVRVPDDVSVVGFDDHPLADVWSPALTTYRQDFAAAGRRAARLLVERLGARSRGEDLPSRRVELPGELVIRDSEAAPRAR
ncbi:LacI family DNA-binding transcriptional regulator [Bifidobacterium aerophilum]|uniref:LacI family DNA-binding transcriptional regulator n=1 Tax=Bifidobacterium aerophilum TaxID=1798155 RepID=A0A6N9Z4X7_9BIFI|nr:LacI family DNA-binding transcriptional regulator [Bifidobacterium aerophilum]NEG89486.1 LacI family DNA-binding transcriptional regulator [Bifidobacterium aerophilum]